MGGLKTEISTSRSARTNRNGVSNKTAAFGEFTGELADKAWVNGKRYSMETWHEYCKGVLLGFDIKAMPDGTEVKTPISTTTLNTAEMTDYQNRLQSWAAGEFGIIWEF